MDHFLLACFLSGALGITTHRAIFIKGDWDKHAASLAHIFFTGPIFFLLFLAIRGNQYALQLWAAVFLSYNCGLCLSIAAYRAVLNPLNHFDGPWVARVTAFWSFKSAVIDSKWHVRVQELHNTYGDFVRIRPREVSISNPAAIREIHGPSTRCTKGAFYDLNYPHRSLLMARDKAFHSKRRRLWDRGFSSKALVQHEPSILDNCQELMGQLRTRAHDRVEVTEWVTRFAFDSMGVLAFGKSFNTVKQGYYHPKQEQLVRYKKLGGTVLCVPWVMILIRNLPLTKTREFIDWCAEEVEERKRRDEPRCDLFSYLIEDSLSASNYANKATGQDLVFDSELAILAGSDTTAASASGTLFLLAKHPDTLAKLRAEIDTILSNGGSIAHPDLIGKPYLEGCIKEGLRLCPAVLSGLPRETGPEGATIVGRYIPPYTIVSIPTYTIQRDPRNFKDPDAFIPERWFSKPEMILTEDAFNPFSTGAYACVGKNFALMEMRLLIATIVRNFEFKLAPEDEGSSLFTLGGTGLQDCFTTHVPPYHLIFKNRN